LAHREDEEMYRASFYLREGSRPSGEDGKGFASRGGGPPSRYPSQPYPRGNQYPRPLGGPPEGGEGTCKVWVPHCK